MVFTFAIIFVCSLITSPRNHITNIAIILKPKTLSLLNESASSLFTQPNNSNVTRPF